MTNANLVGAKSRADANEVDSRWVMSKSGIAHLDCGERSSMSLRVHAEHVIVTACRAHMDAAAPPAASSHQVRCSNCVRYLLTSA